MPWKVRDEMELREEFVLESLEPGVNFSALCRRFGISRKTGYKWVSLYEKHGRAGLKNRSRRPHTSPLRVSAEMTIEVLTLRDSHPRWGPVTLREVLVRGHGEDQVPNERTIARILERAGRVAPRKRRCDRKSEPLVRPEVSVKAPNDLWTVDFKGWWRTRDEKRFEPLTVRDALSRFLLCAQSLATTRADAVRVVFETLFSDYGLPLAILVDNGSPFISMTSLEGLTTLSAWWVSLGIRLVRTRPAHPQDNGAHERMHRTMAEDVEAYPAADRPQQQAELDAWRHEFNHVRPHHGLAMRVPADVYAPSPRRYNPNTVFTYEDAPYVRKVASNGYLKLNNTRYFVSTALGGHFLAIRERDRSTYEFWFANHCLGTASEDATKVVPDLDAA